MNDGIFDFTFAICDWTRVPCGPARGGHVRSRFAGTRHQTPGLLNRRTTPRSPIANRKSKIANP
jgi:hypothetical protein